MKQSDSKFGNALRAWRKETEMSGGALGARLHISAAQISQLELGGMSPSEAILSNLRKLGFVWDTQEVAATPASPQTGSVSVPLYAAPSGRQYTEAELDSTPWQNNQLTLRTFLRTNQLIADCQIREQAGLTIPFFKKDTYFVDAFMWYRDSRAAYFMINPAEYEHIRTAAFSFINELLLSWQQLPVLQRRTIKQAVEDSLRANEKWLEKGDRYVNRRDTSIGSPLISEMVLRFQAIESIVDPEAAATPFLAY